MAIATRIRTGTIVQATSRSVLWVVLEGTGFRFSLKRTAMMTIRPSTKRQMIVMSQTS